MFRTILCTHVTMGMCPVLHVPLSKVRCPVVSGVTTSWTKQTYN